MIKKKILISFILIIFLIPFISAETNTVDVQDIFQLGSIRYAKPCFFNGTYCSSSAECNLTVFYPNNTVLLDNRVMTNSISEHNVSFTSNTLGIHKADQVCKDQGFFASNTFYFEVTTSGNILSIEESIIYVIFLIASIFFLGLLLWGSIAIPYRNPTNPEGHVIGIQEWGYVKVICIVFSYVVLMWILGIVRSIMFNYLFIDGAYRIFNWGFQVMFAFLWPLIVVSFLVLLVNFINNRKFIKALERGVPFRK